MFRCLVLSAVVALPSSACLTYEDPCLEVECPENRVCIALEDGIQCICDENHVEVDGSCEEVPANGAEDGE
jgi:hypothetical protein